MKGTDLIVREEGDLLTTSVDGELIGMSVEQGLCYGFNPVATRLWELIESPCSLDSLCARLVAEFDVGEEECRADILAFVEELRGEGLVSIRPAE